METLNYLEKIQRIAYSEDGLKDLRKELFDQMQRVDYKRIIAENPRFARSIFQVNELPATDREIKILVDAYLAKQKAFIYDVPTRFENAYHYNIVQSHLKDLKSAIEEFGYIISRKITVGTVPSGSIDAQAILMRDSPDSEVLILIESGVFSFANQFSKVLGRCLSTSSSTGLDYTIALLPEEYESNIEKFEDIPLRFNRILDAIVYSGSADNTPLDIELSEPASRLAANLRDYMELFMIAHEHAHVILGHLDWHKKRNLCMLGKASSFDVLDRSWLDEFEADNLAMELVLHIAMRKRHNPTIAFWGIELFFACIKMIDMAICFNSGLEYNSFYGPNESHPLPQVRLGFLQHRMASKRKDDEYHPVLDDFFVSNILDIIWNKSVMHHASGVAAKLRPAIKWRHKIGLPHQHQRKYVGFEPFNINDWLDKNGRK